MTLAEIIAIAMEDPTFIAGMSSNDLWFGNNTSLRLTDAVADVARAAQGKADSDHSHTGYAPSDHSHDGYANADHSHVGFSGTSASTYKMVYVATNGNDDNDGLSAAAPMATIKGAVRKYAEKYKMLDIRLADGTYNEDLGTFAVDQCNMSIRSLSSDKNAVTINTATALDTSLPELRLYNLTVNVTATNIRAVCVNAGIFYAYGVRLNVPEASTASCLNVYNGTSAFIMDSILNSGTATNSGAAVYGNQAQNIKAINCTSERTVRIGFHAHNGTDIIYTDTIPATTKTKATSWGKCTLRT